VELCSAPCVGASSCACQDACTPADAKVFKIEHSAQGSGRAVDKVGSRGIMLRCSSACGGWVMADDVGKKAQSDVAKPTSEISA